MRRSTSLLLGAALVPGLLALPVVSAASAEPVPVEPTIQTFEPEGVDTDVLAAGQAGGEVDGAEPAILTAEQKTDDFDLVGLTWDSASRDPVSVQVRVREDGSWTGWEELPIEDSGPDPGTEEYLRSRAGTSPLVTDGADGVQLRVDTVDGSEPADVQLQLVDAGESPADDAVAPLASADAATAAPVVITREQWGADESLRQGTPRVNQTVKAVIIHHTAGSNSYSRDGAFSQIRGIYAYHTQSLGWDDIAYNLLVDRYGRVFEGRKGSVDLAVRAAHSGGFNVDTYGVGVMGNFEAAAIPQAAVDAVSRVVGWKAGQYGIDPYGKAQLLSLGGGTSRYKAGARVTIDAISGHRDVGSTSCPGKNFYPKLGEVRAAAAATADGYDRLPGPGFPRDWSGDGLAGLMAVDGRGTLWTYPGDGREGFRTRVATGSAWSVMSLATLTGDIDGDGHDDLIARRDSTDELVLYPGDGRGGSTDARVIGTGWGAMTDLIAPGDWDGDGLNDLLGVHESGRLFLYAGQGGARFRSGVGIGSGWYKVDLITAVGDIDGTGTPDVVARSGDHLVLYPGDGSGGWKGAKVLSDGWSGFRDVFGPGALDSSGGHDIVAERSDGALMLYSGNGYAEFATGRQVGRGWNGYDLVG